MTEHLELRTCGHASVSRRAASLPASACSTPRTCLRRNWRRRRYIIQTSGLKKLSDTDRQLSIGVRLLQHVRAVREIATTIKYVQILQQLSTKTGSFRGVIVMHRQQTRETLQQNLPPAIHRAATPASFGLAYTSWNSLRWNVNWLSASESWAATVAYR